MGTRNATTRGAPPWPPGWLRWLPPALILLSLTLQGLTPPPYFFGSLLSAAVLLSALVYRPLTTAAVGLGCVAMLAGLDALDESGFNPEVLPLLAQLGEVTVAGMLLAYARERTIEQLTRVRAVAEAAQRALLRPLPKRLGTVRLAGFYRAADDEALIGGDLYSVQSTPFGVRVLIGDVRGKGLGAAETVSTILAVFREAAMTYSTLSEVAWRIEQALAVDRSTHESAAESDEQFATAVLMEFPEREPAVRVLDRGHPPLLAVQPGGAVALRASEPGLPLGLGELAQQEETTDTFALPPGHVLVAYSDGVTEARDQDGVFYPLRERLSERFGQYDGPTTSPTSGVLTGRPEPHTASGKSTSGTAADGDQPARGSGTARNTDENGNSASAEGRDSGGAQGRDSGGAGATFRNRLRDTFSGGFRGGSRGGRREERNRGGEGSEGGNGQSATRTARDAGRDAGRDGKYGKYGGDGGDGGDDGGRGNGNNGGGGGGGGGREDGRRRGSRTDQPQPIEVVRFIQRDVSAWSPALGDDIVVVAMRHDPKPPVPSPTSATRAPERP